jgi:Cutinase
MSRFHRGLLVAFCLTLGFAVSGSRPSTALTVTASRIATPHSETARWDSWRATYSYLAAGPGESGPRFVHQHLTIMYGAKAVAQFDIPDSMWPGGFGTRRSIFFYRLDEGETPELVLTLWSGGPYCCSVWEVYRLSQDIARPINKDFGEVGVKLIKIDGRTLLLSGSSSFSDRYAAHSDTGYPIQIWHYAQGVLADVTREYPVRIRADAAQWWAQMHAAINGNGRSPRGYAAAWAADEGMLGQAISAKVTLLNYANRGLLRDVHEVSAPDPAVERAFVEQLWRDLAQLGYLRAPSTVPTCPTFYLVDSRGSGEDGGTVSPPGAAFLRVFRQLVAPRGVKAIPNGYPARGGFDVLAGAKLKVGSAYLKSEASGVDWLSAQIPALRSKCPASKLILTGYSQGAQVTADVIDQGGNFSNVAGAVLFGDPKFNGKDVNHDRGSYRYGVNGGLGARPLFPLKHVLSYCHANDPVCQNRANPLAGFTWHDNYDKLGEPAEAARYLTQLLK